MKCSLDVKGMCKLGSFMSEHLDYSFSKHFAFEAYETLVKGGSIPDLHKGLTNGTLCETYVKNYISFVSVSSPTGSIVRTIHDNRFTFNDKLGTVGGTLGLFTGMSILSIAEVFIFSFVLVASIIYELISFLRNPFSILNWFTEKKDQKKQCDNERQMTCASHKECGKKLYDIHVSQ